MATVNGLTAERMLEIEANVVVGGAVVGDDLILTKHDGSTINAGHVRGDPGPVDLEEWLDFADPPGTPKPYEHSVLPARHGWCDAATEYDGDLYPKLAAIFLTGANCVNGACADGFFRLPNHKGRFMIARDSTIAAYDTLRETGGSKDAVVVDHDHGVNASADQDAHLHTVPHGHTADQAPHTHTIDGDGGDRIAFTYPSTHATVTVGGGDATAQEVAYGHLDAADPGITVSFDSPNSNWVDPNINVSVDVLNAGVSGVDKNLPPYRVVNVIMRLT